ncbi:uncharacterized protein LOC129750143 [Uranotaenia lowii]|uniref:uncharacterized protein LOC129750143 n=1 Tax=Uranotaenia lowii TaxID=190385 RepID=UPI00247B1BB8|nr:uncharacterized protein LOC129750143 [Uranotaenia lowii]
MNRLAVVLFALGAIAGQSNAAYPFINLAGSELLTIAKDLNNISVSVTLFNNTLNPIHDGYLKSANDIMNTVTNYYKALNATLKSGDYTLTLLQNAFSTLATMNSTIKSFDQSMTNNYIYKEIQTNAYGMQLMISNLVQGFTNMLYSGGMGISGQNQTVVESCVLNNATFLQAANVSLGRYSACINNQTAAINLLAPIASNFFGWTALDIPTLFAQSSICTAGTGSNACSSTYSQSIPMELTNILTELNLGPLFLSFMGSLMTQWHNLCITMTANDITDILNTIVNNIQACQMSAGLPVAGKA